MLKMMAAENMSDWRVTPAVITEAVWAAKQFLDDIFDKCETLEDVSRQHNPGHVAYLAKKMGPDAFAKIRLNGVGADTVSSFLGDNWDRSAREALSALAEDSARAQAERLRKRQEREAAKTEAARYTATTTPPTLDICI